MGIIDLNIDLGDYKSLKHTLEKTSLESMDTFITHSKRLLSGQARFGWNLLRQGTELGFRGPILSLFKIKQNKAILYIPKCVH